MMSNVVWRPSDPAKVKTAATLFSMLPGLKLFFHGQLEGKTQQAAGATLPAQNEPRNHRTGVVLPKLVVGLPMTRWPIPVCGN